MRLEVPRQNIPQILSNLLANYNIEDVGVQERPLEEVIAELFRPTRCCSDNANGEPRRGSIPNDGTSAIDVEAEQPVDR